jgi:hypothetical protein
MRGRLIGSAPTGTIKGKLLAVAARAINAVMPGSVTVSLQCSACLRVVEPGNMESHMRYFHRDEAGSSLRRWCAIKVP